MPSPCLPSLASIDGRLAATSLQLRPPTLTIARLPPASDAVPDKGEHPLFAHLHFRQLVLALVSLLPPI